MHPPLSRPLGASAMPAVMPAMPAAFSVAAAAAAASGTARRVGVSWEQGGAEEEGTVAGVWGAVLVVNEKGLALGL